MKHNDAELAGALSLFQLRLKPHVLGASFMKVFSEIGAFEVVIRVGMAAVRPTVARVKTQENGRPQVLRIVMRGFFRTLGMKVATILINGPTGAVVCVRSVLRSRVIFMVAGAGEQRNGACESACLFPKFIPVSLFSARFHQIARYQERVGPAVGNGCQVSSKSVRLIHEIAPFGFIFRAPFGGVARAFRFRFAVGERYQPNRALS